MGPTPIRPDEPFEVRIPRPTTTRTGKPVVYFYCPKCRAEAAVIFEKDAVQFETCQCEKCDGIMVKQEA